MRTTLKLLILLLVLASFGLIASPAQAAKGSWVCAVSPGSGPVGTTFTIACSGFTPNRTVNIWANEPDGRTSGLNIYGFFPTNVGVDGKGVVTFNFATMIPGFFAVGAGDYIFTIRQPTLDGGGASDVIAMVTVHVRGSTGVLKGATLSSKSLGFQRDPFSVGPLQQFEIMGTGFVPGENANVWVTQPPAAFCSGLGIDQLTLGTLAGNGSSIWSAPGTVSADGSGDIDFVISFRPSACVGVYQVSVRAPRSGIGGFTNVTVTGKGAPTGGNGTITVTPDRVLAFHSLHTVSGSGFPADTNLNCWYTRPDGRVLFFINFNASTDASGSFSVQSVLDDFPPFTSTEPGWWHVTCATPSQSASGVGKFLVVQGFVDP